MSLRQQTSLTKQQNCVIRSMVSPTVNEYITLVSNYIINNIHGVRRPIFLSVLLLVTVTARFEPVIRFLMDPLTFPQVFRSNFLFCLRGLNSHVHSLILLYVVCEWAFMCITVLLSPYMQSYSVFGEVSLTCNSPTFRVTVHHNSSDQAHCLAFLLQVHFKYV